MTQTGPLKLHISPAWEAIDGVRDAVIAFLREHGEDEGLVASVSMVACELTENAIKYGRFRDGDGVEIAVGRSDAAVTVEVRHRTSQEDMPRLTRLDRAIQWIRGFQDPFEAYVARLKEVALQPPQSGESGLGLVRIAYEGESSLDFCVGEDETLAVSAVYHR